jgi:hypothetical protein
MQHFRTFLQRVRATAERLPAVPALQGRLCRLCRAFLILFCF